MPYPPTIHRRTSPSQRRGRVAFAYALLLVALALLSALAPATVGAAKPRRPGSQEASGQGQVPQALEAQLKSSKDGVLPLTSSTFDVLLPKHGARNYSSVVVLTALNSGINCGPCQSFAPNFDRIAAIWKRKANAKGKAWSGKQVVFGRVEFKDGREIFQRFGLAHAPVLLHFPPTDGSSASSSASFDFQRNGFDAEDVTEWLSKQLGFPFPYSKPIPWFAISVFTASLVGTSSLILVLWPRIAALQQRRAGPGAAPSDVGSIRLSSIVRFFSMVGSLAVITVMCSGYMWNSIRGAPYALKGADGSAQFIAPGFSNQYGAETQIIAGFYALLAFSFVSLTVFVPAQRDPLRQRAGVYVWSAVFLAAFSILFAVFRLKNPSYPFRLFL